MSVPFEASVVMGAGLSEIIPKETMMEYWGKHVQGLADEQLETVGKFVDNQKTWLEDMSVVVSYERQRRNPQGDSWDVV